MGTGWLPIPFSQNPLINISKLPINPLNKPPYYYSYVVGGSYELTTALESEANKGKDKTGGQDGGDHNFVYEVGTNKKLTLSSVQARAEPDSLKQGLVGWWSFDEGSGNVAKDYSGNNNNGTLNNGPTWVDGKVGKALSFDGVNDYVDLRNINSFIDQYSISVWIKASLFNVAEGDDVLAGTDPNNYHGILMEIGDGTSAKLRFLHRFPSGISGGDSFYSNIILNTNTWYHIVYTRTSDYYRIYVNGQLDKYFPISAGPFTYELNVVLGRLGKDWPYRYFNGIIDEVRIYNRALSADEIKALYEATK